MTEILVPYLMSPPRNRSLLPSKAKKLDAAAQAAKVVAPVVPGTAARSAAVPIATALTGPVGGAIVGAAPLVAAGAAELFAVVVVAVIALSTVVLPVADGATETVPLELIVGATDPTVGSTVAVVVVVVVVVGVVVVKCFYDDVVVVHDFVDPADLSAMYNYLEQYKDDPILLNNMDCWEIDEW